MNMLYLSGIVWIGMLIYMSELSSGFVKLSV